VEAFWRAFLDDDRHFRFEPVLLHGDLSPEHILVDLERTAITGVIDFGDAVVGDPAGDFGGFDAAFRQAALVGYELPIDDTLLSRAVVYWKLGPFHEVLYGLQIQEQKHVEAGLEGIRRRVVGGE
jgi:aminoglycoside 2''-phosphotransferase